MFKIGGKWPKRLLKFVDPSVQVLDSRRCLSTLVRETKNSFGHGLRSEVFPKPPRPFECSKQVIPIRVEPRETFAVPLR
jgi:hypothetical protein